MTPTTETILRAVLKIGAGILVTKGYADDSTAEVIVAGLMALYGVFWGIVAARSTLQNNPQATPTPPEQGIVPLLLLCSLVVATGCAINRQTASTTTTNPTNGVVTVTVAKSSVIAFGDVKNAVEKTRATAGKTSSVGASGVNEETTSGAAATLGELLGAAIKNAK